MNGYESLDQIARSISSIESAVWVAHLLLAVFVITWAISAFRR